MRVELGHLERKASSRHDPSANRCARLRLQSDPDACVNVPVKLQQEFTASTGQCAYLLIYTGLLKGKKSESFRLF